MKITIFFQTKRPMRSNILHALQICFMSDLMGDTAFVSMSLFNILWHTILVKEYNEKSGLKQVCDWKREEYLRTLSESQGCSFLYYINIWLVSFLKIESEWKLLSCVQLFVTPWHSPGKSTGVGSLSLLQRIFPTQGSNPGLPHCR